MAGDPMFPTMVAPPILPVIARLIDECGARWVDEASIDAWLAEPGTAVLLIAGDPVRFPEAADVAAVLPELQRSSATRFRIGVARRDSEDGLARRYGALRRPVLVCWRDGGYLGELSGMYDWADYVREMAAVLAMPVSSPRVALGIPVVAAPGCH